MNEDNKLIESIERLEKATRKTTSLGWNVLRGICYSIGWAVGLALLVTLAIYTLPKIGEGNAVGQFVQSIANILNRN